MLQLQETLHALVERPFDGNDSRAFDFVAKRGNSFHGAVLLNFVLQNTTLGESHVKVAEAHARRLANASYASDIGEFVSSALKTPFNDVLPYAELPEGFVTPLQMTVIRYGYKAITGLQPYIGVWFQSAGERPVETGLRLATDDSQDAPLLKHITRLAMTGVPAHQVPKAIKDFAPLPDTIPANYMPQMSELRDLISV